MKQEWKKKFDNTSSSEKFASLFEKERERLSESLRNNIGNRRFTNLTQMEIDHEIMLRLMMELTPDYEPFEKYPIGCFVKLNTARLIHRQSKWYRLTIGETLDAIVGRDPINDPDFAAAMSIMYIQMVCSHQSIEQRIRTMFIIMGACMKNILLSKLYTFDEAVEGIRANLDELRNILDRMKYSE